MCERCEQLEKELEKGKAAHEALVVGFKRLAQNALAEFSQTYNQESEKVSA